MILVIIQEYDLYNKFVFDFFERVKNGVSKDDITQVVAYFSNYFHHLRENL